MKNYKGTSVNYTFEQYLKLRERYSKWWNNELNEPISGIITSGHESKREPSKNPSLYFGTAWDFSISPDQFVDAHDWHLSQTQWHGDTFPIFATTAFGPGTAAAFMGCTPIGTPNTVWFAPPYDNIPIEELHFEFNPENKYLRRVINLYEAAMEKWRGSVVVGMVDMGGVLDILSSFRGAENLLCDLYDSPDEVIRCVNEIQELWFRYYNLFNSMMDGEAMGYSDWFHMYGEKPGYILQSDFSYMMGPEMFDKFTAPELSSSGAKMKNAVYHMDGIGQIPHLDTLLSIDSIKGIQWVPGDGEPSMKNWDEILEKILSSGRKLLSWAQKPDGHPIDIAKDLGQLYIIPRHFHITDIEQAKKYADIYGIEIK